MPQANDNDREELEQVFFRLLAEGYRSDSAYDCLVLFSGGKDSTYAAHRLKQARGERVCLFTVDNGLPPNPPKAGQGNCGNFCLFTAEEGSEKKSLSETVKKVAAQLQLDLYIYQPPPDDFKEYYKFLITEESLKKVDSNPLCFFCGRYFMALGLAFAERNNIPFVMYGATPMQITGKKLPRTLRDVEIFNMVSKRMLMGTYKKLQALERYQSDPVIKKIIDKTFYFSDKAKLIFPFQYLDYDIEHMKQTLENEYGWENPTGISNVVYLTSGCPMVNLFGVLVKKRGFGLHELQQIESDYADGTLGREAYEYNKDLFEKIMQAEVDAHVETLAKIIGVEEILEDDIPG